MIKENLIYPVLKEVDQGMINLHSEDFNVTVHVFDEDIIKGISEIKKSIILKMMELSKNNEIDSTSMIPESIIFTSLATKYANFIFIPQR